MPAEKKLPQDTINRFVPEKNPGQIDQGAFNVPFNSDSPDDDGNGHAGIWIIPGMVILLALMFFSGRKKTVAK